MGKSLNPQGRIGDDKELAKRVAAAGGVCQEKFEGTADRDEFTLEHSQRVQDAFEHMLQFSPTDSCLNLIEQLATVLEGILRDPEHPSVRQIPVPQELMQIEGSRRLAEAIGFEFIMLDE